MNKIHFIFATFLTILLLSSSGWVNAKDQVQTKTQEATIPKGYEGLFGEISDVMKKYPGAADRFRIFDRKSNAGETIRSGSFHACCEWACDEPRCACTKQCLE